MFGKNKEQQPDLEFFTIFDSKSKSYSKPIQEINKDVLLRAIINDFGNPETHKTAHYLNSEDFAIFRIGSFDRKTGTISSQNLEHIANLHDLRALAQPSPGPGALSST